MMISLNVMGYGPMGQALVKKFKNLEYYKVDDFDRTKVRVHTVVIRDNNNPKYDNLKAVYERIPEGIFCCLGDGTETTSRETPLCDDIPWLEQTNGHDVIVDVMSYNEEAKNLVLQQIGRGYWGIMCNKELVKNHWQELLEVAKTSPMSNGDSETTPLSFNALAVGLEKYKNINLTEKNFAKYADDPELYEIHASVDEVTDAIIEELDREYWIRLKKDENWRNRSEEEKLAQVQREHEEHERLLATKPPVPPKESKNSVTINDACGVNDTVDWEKYKSKLFESDRKFNGLQD